MNQEEDKKLSKKKLKRLAKQASKGKIESVKPEEGRFLVQLTTRRRGNLTVSGHLNVETHAFALSYLYTFGPTFRAQISHTAMRLL